MYLHTCTNKDIMKYQFIIKYRKKVQQKHKKSKVPLFEKRNKNMIIKSTMNNYYKTKPTNKLSNKWTDSYRQAVKQVVDAKEQTNSQG